MTRINSSNATPKYKWQENIEHKINPSRWNSNLIQRFTVTITLLTLTFGCIPAQQFKNRISSTLEKNPISINNCDLISHQENNSQISTLVSQNSSSTRKCASIDPFSQAVRFATKASNLAQYARTKQQWDRVAQEWVQAVAWMQAVPPENPRRVFAEKKVAEYMRNLAYSQQQAASAPSEFNPVSFNSDILDIQLKLYLSYIATVGVPDVLIVGSSRALYGVAPQQLQQYLMAKGYPRLNIFNFGINGATGQVVDFQLRQLLSSKQLPRLIIWADGVRAFNSGRVDRTYNSIVASEGKRLLLSGIRPQLPQAQSNFASTCYQFPQAYNVFSLSPNFPLATLQEKTIMVKDNPLKSNNHTKHFYKSIRNFQKRFSSLDAPVPQSEFLDRPIKQTSSSSTSNTQYSTQVVQTVAIANAANAIDANGFLAIDGQFNPSYYYQRQPYVAGLYDGDYASFYLGGIQGTALNSVVNFTKSRNIPLVFVNLPLSDSYLDFVRWSAEEEFHPWMQRRATENDFIFLNFNLYQPQLAKNEYFFDPSHLNRYGASAVARYLAANAEIAWPR
ncbi:MAG: hypothetical protein O4859_13020 [Trichodesmium sp. St18_bin1]|mgnify:FL=1|nr:hypothetical protein [Trichodesmium sp. St18_bin1]MDE5120595.1 hypothetical protein [Trichodesmium sp. St19_bin1]